MAAVTIPRNETAALIDAYRESNVEAPRPHLGASLLGHECDRWLWLSFRWAVIEKFSGRILRLFDRGKREEAIIISHLRSIGMVVDGDDGTGKQFRVDFGGHVGGSMDGIIESGVPEAPTKRHILEMKTHSLKSFNELCEKGVQKAKPLHYAQMQVYMHGSGIDRALYAAICKDDDRYWFERVRYDRAFANKLVTRGDRIVMSDRLPEPMSTDSTWWKCKFCAAHEFCFETHLTQEINCRTCVHSTATPHGTWECARYRNAVIPYEAQVNGCDSHAFHPDLVPWEMLPARDQWTPVWSINGVEVANGESDEHVLSSRELLGKKIQIENGEDIVTIPF